MSTTDEMTSFTEKVKEAIEDYNMLPRAGHVCVAVSGGADSVSLLFVLLGLGYEVRAVHVNHGLRGFESDMDEEFCRRICREAEVPLTVRQIDVAPYAKACGMSIEEAARKMRYDVLLGECRLDGGGFMPLATAHTLSDSAETTLINFTRGTGLRGFCGVPPKRDGIIRPLIYVTRSEVEAYLSAIHQDYVTDSTNLCDEYTRNKIRHQIMPVLREINKGFYTSALS